MMPSGGETTLEDEIIYQENISKALDEAQARIEANNHVGSLRMTLETLVYKAVKEWTLE
jgi:hypothetical protein